MHNVVDLSRILMANECHAMKRYKPKDANMATIRPGFIAMATFLKGLHDDIEE